MKQTLYRRLAQLERMEVEARQTEQYGTGPSGTEVINRLLSNCASPVTGESRAETLARTAGITTRELKNLLSGRCLHAV